jgi:hypothetical protein
MKRIAWKKVGIGAAIALPVLMIAVQMCYSWQSTMLFAKVDGVAVGGMSRDEAVARVNDEYAAAKVAISFGASKKPYRTPSLKELGVTVASDAVDTVMYPWWLRLVPTSLWWGYAVAGDANSTAGVSKEKIAQHSNWASRVVLRQRMHRRRLKVRRLCAFRLRMAARVRQRMSWRSCKQ